MVQPNLITQKIGLHRTLAEKLTTIYAQKNHDYGDSFGETFRKLGPISAITRMSDKFNRLCSLITLPDEERKVKDESIEDTLMDLANYAIMTLLEMQMTKNDTNLNGTFAISTSSNNSDSNSTSSSTTVKKSKIESRLEKVCKAENIVLYFNSVEQLQTLLQYFSDLQKVKIDNTVGQSTITINDLTIGNSIASLSSLKTPDKGYIVIYKSVVDRYDYHLGYIKEPREIEGSFAVMSCTELLNPRSANFDKDGTYKFAHKI